MDHGGVLVWLALGAVVVAAVAAGRRTSVPHLVVLFVVGLGMSFIPGFDVPRLSPDVVFLGFLPVLVYNAAYFTPARDLATHWRPILLLAVGLVLATLGAVAVVAHEVVHIGWGPAFVLGAVVGPTDPVTATAIVSRLGAPGDVTTILEGEGLVNDGIALVVFRVAVGATVAGSFSLGGATARFAIASAGGVAIGVAAGWASTLVRRHLDDPPVEIAVSLLIPYVAYVPADALGLSGVLAAVAAGLTTGWYSHDLYEPAGRLRAYAFWDTVVFLLNAVLFIALGLQFRTLTRGLGRAWTELVIDALAIAGTVVVVRISWEMVGAPIRHLLAGSQTGWRSRLVLGWAGMRGAVSLAAALSIPLTVRHGAPFPSRDMVLFLTFAVILVTVVGEAPTLPTMIRRLGLARDESERRVREARITAARAALARLDEIEDDDWVPEGAVELNRRLYETRLRRLRASPDGAAAAEVDGDGDDERFRRLRLELIASERAAVLALQAEGHASGEDVRRVERLLDLDEARMRA